jgi:hypothetical protein
MPLQKIQLRPGLNREGTDYSNEGGYSDGDKIRFRSGFPEKIGGWVRLSNFTFWGICRSLWNWSTLNGSNLLGVGTNLKYYIESGGAYNDITPIVENSNYVNAISVGFTTLVNTISTTDTTIVFASKVNFPEQNGIIKIQSEQIFYNYFTGNAAISCIRGYNNTTAATHTAGANIASGFFKWYDTNNDANDRDFVIISNCSVSNVGGIANTIINGEHQTFKYTPSNDYSLATTADANLANLTFSTFAASNTANISVAYEYPVGLEVYSLGTGWGAGPWSRNGWGEAYYGGTGVGQQLRLWSNDNYGENLVIAPRGGAIFYWIAANGVTTRAKLLSTLTEDYDTGTGQWVPKRTNLVVSSAIQRFLITYSSNSYDPNDSDTPFDPMLIRWSDQENPYVWIPKVTNQAGEFRLTNGSYIVTAKSTRQEILVWTDSAIYSQQYLGPPYVWGFNLLMDNISIISPDCSITINNVTYWMGTDKFYMYSGRVETLPCALRQYIFADINKDQAFQVTCGSNEGFNEVWWFYCSLNSLVIDKYVVYNYLDRVWYYGAMSRTAWLDSGIRPSPMAALINRRDAVGNPIGQLLFHEVGNDDVSGLTPVPIEAYVQSSDFDIGDGHNFALVWRMLPDINFNGSSSNQPTVQLQLRPRQNSGTAYNLADDPTVQSAQSYVKTPVYTVQEFTGQVFTRLRGRQMAMRVSSSDLGVAWQLGSPRIDIKNDGRRS